MDDASRLTRFESTVLVHLDAAYNLARWLTLDKPDADDAVQEACLRAYRFFDGQHGPSTKAWFMAVVRNACLDGLKDRGRRRLDVDYDDDAHSEAGIGWAAAAESPEAAALRAAEARQVRDAIASLPRDYREVIVLRELEELSYKEISAIVEVPIGTVMSRLSRGRDLLQRRFAEPRLRTKS